MPNYSSKFGCSVIIVGSILICSPLTVQAAEIRLKNTPIRSSESLITLADIADVLPMGNENVEPLRQTALFPTPTDGTTRTLDQWEVRSTLSQLGINSLHHSLSGAEKITVSGIVATRNPSEQFVIQANYLTPAGTNPVKPIDVQTETAPPMAGQTDDWSQMLEREIAKALNVYLNFTNRIERSWDISLKLTSEQVKFFASNGQIVEITGGQIPYTGTQRFHIRMQSHETITVDAVVALPMEVVVVRRALPKGHIITESDIMLQRADRVQGEDFFVDIKTAVGKETVRAVKELSPLTQSAVRLPIWVRREDIVTVRAVNGGILVRTEATALQDGVEGDIITVKKINLTPGRGKKEEPVTYLVRVCAPKTVEVFVK